MNDLPLSAMLLEYLDARVELAQLDGWIGKSTSADVLVPVYSAIRSLRQGFHQLLCEQKIFWTIQASIGRGGATPDHYIAFLPPGQRVSNGIYYCICFDRDGIGGVMGAMTSLFMPQHIEMPLVQRAVKTENSISKNTTWVMASNYEVNVWGRNNAFFNPLEFTRNSLSITRDNFKQKWLAHFECSKKLILELNAKKKNYF